MRVFFDNCTSPALAATIGGYLSELGHDAKHIRDLPCGRNATDIAWIEYLAKTDDDWLVITGDRRISKNKAERIAYRQANLKGFVLAPTYQKTAINRQASILLWRWPDIEALLKLAPPFLFEVPINRGSGLKQLPF